MSFPKRGSDFRYFWQLGRGEGLSLYQIMRTHVKKKGEREDFFLLP